MRDDVHSGKHCFVEAWLPEHDPDVVVLIWNTPSFTTDSSFFTAEVFYNTYLIEELNGDSLEGLRSSLREQYGPGQEPNEGIVFSPATQMRREELVDA